MPIQLRVLGCFRLSVDGEPVEISPVPARILAYLALQHREAERSAMARVLWPETVHERALGNLRSALWRLPGGSRHAVTECGTSLRLSPEVVCDLELIERGLSSAASEDAPDVLTWEWRDELLAGWYDDWVLSARDRLQARRAVALERLSLTSCTRGLPGDALLYAAFAVGAQPLRESAHRALLRAHLDRGNRREAVQLYRELALMLRQELGVAPSVETAALMGDLGEAVA
jgi:DNA-binding SARP family transcriptional activator